MSDKRFLPGDYITPPDTLPLHVSKDLRQMAEEAGLGHMLRQGGFKPKDLSGSLPTVYVAGSLANPNIVTVTQQLQDSHFDVFSEWYTPGPEADVLWRDYEQALGFTYREALKRPSAQNTYLFDKRHIDNSDVMLMVLPCGKSAHLELGYVIGQGKPGYILMPEEPDRWDVMYNFATKVVYSVDEFIQEVSK